MKDKLKRLWADDRSFKQRFWLCFLPPLMLAYTVLFFGPVELYCANPNAVRFSLADLCLGMGAAALGAFVLGFVVLLLLRGKLLNLASGLVFGFGLACYLQGNFMNLDLGVLDGEAIPWQDYTAWALVNLGLWVLILAFPLVMLHFKPKGFQKLVAFGSALIIAVQTVALVVLVPSAPSVSRDYYHIDSEKIFEISDAENTIVFILDRFPTELMDICLEQAPELAESFKDFTWFENYAPRYLSTYPAVNAMLTGHLYDGTEPARDYMDLAWESDSATAFYGRMREAGFTNRVYINTRYTIGQEAALRQQVDNIGHSTLSMNYPAMVKTMTKLSGYRYLPHAVKARFWMETEDLGGAEGDILYTDFYNENFIKDLMMQSLRTQSEQDAFTVYHIKGAHSPYVLDAGMNHVEESSWEENAVGVLKIVTTYLEMMDSLGLYDNANIVITTDHGDRDHLAALFMAKRGGEEHSALETSAAPVCSEDLLPTLLDMNGLRYDDLGRSVYDVGEDEKRKRLFTPLGEDDDSPNVGGKHNALLVYEVPDDVRDMKIRDDHEKIPILDSFY